MKTPLSSYQERMNRVLRHIESNLDSPPGLDELGAIACFSPYHFHRIFTAMVGESVAAYVRRLKLQRAAMSLSYGTDRTVTSVALDAGYDSMDAFTRAFRSLFGVPPSVYRRTGGSLASARQRNPEALIFYTHHTETSLMDVQIKTFPPVLTAALRYVGPYNDCGPAWEKLCAAMAAAGVMGEKTTAYSICHDDPDITPAEKCRMEICVSLPEGVTAESPAVKGLLRNGEIYLQTLGGDGDYAAILIRGPYSLLHPAYRSFFGEWLPRSGRELAGAPGFEAYYNCPGVTAPEDLLTEIFIPLQPK